MDSMKGKERLRKSRQLDCFNLRMLSEFRGTVMGFSIILIVLYHFLGKGGVTAVDKIFRLIFSQGYVGVDFFMVVSGLGLTYSMMKDENLKTYYIKRWVRIFPVFTFVTLDNKRRKFLVGIAPLKYIGVLVWIPIHRLVCSCVGWPVCYFPYNLLVDSKTTAIPVRCSDCCYLSSCRDSYFWEWDDGLEALSICL